MATIGKKFSDPDKWESGWFLDLTPEQKLLYAYLWERCDHAGIIEPIPALLSAHIGHQTTAESIENLIQVVNADRERIVRHGQKLWFPEYIRYQQQADNAKPLRQGKPFHKTVFALIQQHGLIPEVQKRDPVLLKDFVHVNDEIPNTSNDKPMINQSLPNVTSKSQGKSKRGSQSESLPGVNGNNRYDPSKFAASFKK